MATNQLDTYAKKFCLTRKMIINDDLGASLKVLTSMGVAGEPEGPARVCAAQTEGRAHEPRTRRSGRKEPRESFA